MTDGNSQYSITQSGCEYNEPATASPSRVENKSTDIYIKSPIKFHFPHKQVFRSRPNVEGGAAARKILGVIPSEREFAQSTQQEVNIITAIEHDLKEQPQLKRTQGPAKLKYQNDPVYAYQLCASQAMEDTQLGLINDTRPRFKAKVLSKKPIRIRAPRAPVAPSAPIPDEPEAKGKDKEAAPVQHKWIICDAVQASQCGVFNHGPSVHSAYSQQSFSVFTNPHQQPKRNCLYSCPSQTINIENGNSSIYPTGSLQQIHNLHKLCTPSDSSSLEPSPTIPLTRSSPSASTTTTTTTTTTSQSIYSTKFSGKTPHLSSVYSSNIDNNSLNTSNPESKQHAVSTISVGNSQYLSAPLTTLTTNNKAETQCSGPSMMTVTSSTSANIDNNQLNITNDRVPFKSSSIITNDKMSTGFKKRSRTRKRGRKKKPKLTDYVVGEYAWFKGRVCCIVDKEVEYEQPTIYTIRFDDDDSKLKTTGKHLLYNPKPNFSPSITHSHHSTNTNSILTIPTTKHSSYSPIGSSVNTTNVSFNLNHQIESASINLECTQSLHSQSSPSSTIKCDDDGPSNSLMTSPSTVHAISTSSSHNIHEQASTQSHSSILYSSDNHQLHIEPSTLINHSLTTPGDFNLRELSPSDPLINEAREGISNYFWSYYPNHWRTAAPNPTNIYAIKWMIAVIIKAIHDNDASLNNKCLHIDAGILANITNQHVNMVNLNIQITINESIEESKYKQWVKRGIIQPPAKFHPNFKSTDYIRHQYFNQIISNSPGLADAAFSVAANVIPDNHNTNMQLSECNNDDSLCEDIIMNIERPVDDIVLGTGHCVLSGGGKDKKNQKSKKKKKKKII